MKALISIVKILLWWTAKLPSNYAEVFSQDNCPVTIPVWLMINFVCGFFKRKVVGNWEFYQQLWRMNEITYSKTVVKFRNKCILLVKLNDPSQVIFKQLALSKKYKIRYYFFLMRDSVATSDTSFFLIWFNFGDCFSKLMTFCWNLFLLFATYCLNFIFSL